MGGRHLVEFLAPGQALFPRDPGNRCIDKVKINCRTAVEQLGRRD